MELTAAEIRRRIGARPARELLRAVWRCGWCKGFVHQEYVSDMTLFVHDERPVTRHEVLPYRER
jgi:hypothetical protein